MLTSRTQYIQIPPLPQQETSSTCLQSLTLGYFFFIILSYGKTEVYLEMKLTKGHLLNKL